MSDEDIKAPEEEQGQSSDEGGQEDYLSMSDEQIENMGTALPPISSEDAPTEEFEEEELDDENLEPTSEEEPEQEDLDPESDEEGDPETYTADEPQEPEVESEEPSEPEEPASESKIDYKAVHDEIFAPFKANGQEMRVKNVKDATKLMQMGANYNKKMAGLKPHLKIVKMLENNDLLDESKLSLAIDVMKGKPEAIAELIKNSDIDPLDLDLEKTERYQPDTYTVSDAEMDLDGVLKEIEHSPAYTATIDIVKNKLDSVSRNVLLTQPDSLRTINAHVESGLYDVVMAEVEQERMLGRLTGMADLDAYKYVGTKLEKEGRFSSSSPESTRQSTPDFNESRNKANKQKEAQRKSRKKAASSPASTKSKAGPKEEFNPLSLPDDQFEEYAKKIGL